MINVLNPFGGQKVRFFACVTYINIYRFFQEFKKKRRSKRWSYNVSNRFFSAWNVYLTNIFDFMLFVFILFKLIGRSLNCKKWYLLKAHTMSCLHCIRFLEPFCLSMRTFCVLYFHVFVITRHCFRKGEWNWNFFFFFFKCHKIRLFCVGFATFCDFFFLSQIGLFYSRFRVIFFV